MTRSHLSPKALSEVTFDTYSIVEFDAVDDAVDLLLQLPKQIRRPVATSDTLRGMPGDLPAQFLVDPRLPASIDEGVPEAKEVGPILHALSRWIT